jgi:hypothetical protein
VKIHNTVEIDAIARRLADLALRIRREIQSIDDSQAFRRTNIEEMVINLVTTGSNIKKN